MNGSKVVQLPMWDSCRLPLYKWLEMSIQKGRWEDLRSVMGREKVYVR